MTNPRSLHGDLPAAVTSAENGQRWRDRSGRNNVLLLESPTAKTVLKWKPDSPTPEEVWERAAPGQSASMVLQSAPDPDAIMHATGRCVGAVHLAPASGLPLAPRPGPFRENWPSIADLPDMSWGQRRLIEIIQTEPLLIEGIDRCLSEWRSVVPIHGDLRAANVLVHSVGAEYHVEFIDWETAGRGEPAWDLGSVMGECVGVWVRSQFGPGVATPHGPQPGEVCPALWQGYAETLGGYEDGLAVRSAGFAALRLIQRSLETTASVSTASHEVLIYLQIAQNIFADLALAARELFGLAI